MKKNFKTESKIFKKIIITIVTIVLLLCFSGCSKKETNGIIVFQSDFGLKDGAVSEMKGIAMSVDNSLKLYDITHEIPAYSIWDAGYRLYQVYKYWPEKTVFVSVVDPGVGSDRLSVVVKMKNGSYIVTPDNGTLTFLVEEIDEIRIIDETKNRLPESESSSTFYGRDVYAYTAARLASGIIKFSDVGEISNQDPVVLEYTKAKLDNNGLSGTIEILDIQFGNVWTNIDLSLSNEYHMEFGKEYDVLIKCDDKVVYSSKVKYVNTFSDVQLGEPLLYINSLEKIALAINNGDFSKTYSISYGNNWSITIH